VNIAEAAMPGLDIVDCHVHIGKSSLLGLSESVEGVLRRMDANGIGRAIITPIPGLEDPLGVASSRATNNAMADAIRRWPDRFPRAFAVVEPRHGPEAWPEIDRAISELGLVGLAFHNDFQGVNLDDPAMFKLLERLGRYPGMFVHAHTAGHSWLEAPYQLGRLARPFPDITFINAHGFMVPRDVAMNIDLAERLPAMLFDTCFTHKHGFGIRTAVEGIGVDRLLFGSDNPYFADHPFDLDLILDAGLDGDDQRKLLGANAIRVFGLN
jgi:uncharacterized protein